LSEPTTRADDEALLRAFVGPRGQDYYLAYFARAEARGYAPIAWHWPVLAFGVLWFLYRKLYLWALVVFLIPYLFAAIATLAEHFLPGTGAPLLWALLVGFLILWLPLYTNGIYYRHARAAVATVRRLQPGNRDAQIAMLEAAGGASPQAPLLLLGVLLLTSLLLGALVGSAT
jgi:hypothetical protein